MEFHTTIPPESLIEGAATPMSLGSKAPTDTSAPPKKELSQAATEILGLRTPELNEPALVVIDEPEPGNPTKRCFMVCKASMQGQSPVYSIKGRDLEAAVQELSDNGYFHSPVDGPGCTVFEFIM